jgi:hypothetical protein
MESNLTAVEWLEQKAKEFAIDLDLLRYFQQAKEIEKKQLQLTYASRCSFFSCENNSKEELANCICGKNHYLQTFNK